MDKSKTLNKDKIIGFIEGEGCFTIQETKGYKYPRFYITQKDYEILTLIRDKLLEEEDIHLSICPSDDNGNFQLYSSTNLEECSKIIDFLEGELIRKKNAFIKFKNFVENRK